MNVEKITIEQASNLMLDLKTAHANGNFNRELKNITKICGKMFNEKQHCFFGENEGKTWSVFYYGFVELFGKVFYEKTIEDMILDNVSL